MVDYTLATEFTPDFFTFIGSMLNEKIKTDMESGIMQNNTRALSYHNKRYIREKGKGIAAYPRKQESTRTSFVDMCLTGDLKRGMKVTNATTEGFEIVFNSNDTDKIEFNEEKYGRRIAYLNDKNCEELAIMIANEIGNNIAEQINKEDIINMSMSI